MQWKEALNMSSRDVLSSLRAMPDGLTLPEATRRLAAHGPNRLAEEEIRWWRILLTQFRLPFVYLLLGAAVLSFVLGEWREGTLIVVFLFANVLLGFFQEYRSGRAVDALREYFAPVATVVRDGAEKVVPAESLVPGDIVLLKPGDIVPADLRFVWTDGLTIDESVLTGESVEAVKGEETVERPSSEMYRAADIGFSGTTVLRGRGRGVVIATGQATAIGEIARFSTGAARQSAFESDIARFGRFLVRLVVGALLLVFLANLAIKGRGADTVELLIFSLVLVVSVLPETLPFFITAALSRGSLRLAKKHVIVKRLASIEELGSIEVLCTDKTGTLTENDISVVSVEAEDDALCTQAMFLAGGHTRLDEADSTVTDPFDRALWEYLSRQQQVEIGDIEIIHTVPFDPIRRRSSSVVGSGSRRELLVRGAPESVLDLCVDISAGRREALLRRVEKEGRQGTRTLAVARRGVVHARQSSTDDEHTLSFVGLVFFTDPVKVSAAQALDEARRLGIQVKMITGDGPEVALAVARRVGLARRSDMVVSGQEWDALGSEDRTRTAERCAIFARISPTQKYEIIEALKRRYTVGFLGDGVNDAPALRLANVALAVRGASGVARAAADVVLLDPSLGVIIDGIREGRVIFSNISKYLKAILASNFGNFYSVALASLLIPFVPMLPVQILLIDILSDIPLFGRIVDGAEPSELRRPRNYDVHGIIMAATFLGLVSSVFDFILFAIFVRYPDQGVLQTNWFLLSLLTEVVLLFSIRTRKWFFQASSAPSWILTTISLVTVGVSMALPYTKVGQEFFRFVPPTGHMLAIIFGLLALYFVATEATKVFYYRVYREDGTRRA